MTHTCELVHLAYLDKKKFLGRRMTLRWNQASMRRNPHEVRAEKFMA